MRILFCIETGHGDFGRTTGKKYLRLFPRRHEDCWRLAMSQSVHTILHSYHLDISILATWDSLSRSSITFMIPQFPPVNKNGPSASAQAARQSIMCELWTLFWRQGERVGWCTWWVAASWSNVNATRVNLKPTIYFSVIPRLIQYIITRQPFSLT